MRRRRTFWIGDSETAVSAVSPPIGTRVSHSPRAIDLERVRGALVNANFFDVLAVSPARGRTFRSDDEGPGAPRVAILSEGFWKERFGGRSDAVGQTIRLNDEPHVIVGVITSRDRLSRRRPGVTDPALVPVPDDPLGPARIRPAAESRLHPGFRRPQAGVTRPQAQADMDNVAAALEHDYPDANRNTGSALTSLHDELVGDVRPTLIISSPPLASSC